MATKMRVKVPKSAKKGEVILIKTMITHPMETGLRKDESGKVVPRLIINKFVCRFNGDEIFNADFYRAVAENPYLTFHFRVMESGTFDFVWTEDTGKEFNLSAEISLS